MKTTKKDFEIFKKSFLHWVDVFGLKGWRVSFEHGEPRGKFQALASLDRNVTGRTAVVTFPKKISKAALVEYPGQHRMARHEAIHLLVSRVSTLHAILTVTEREADEAEEELVYQIEAMIDYLQKNERKR